MDTIYKIYRVYLRSMIVLQGLGFALLGFLYWDYFFNLNTPDFQYIYRMIIISQYYSGKFIDYFFYVVLVTCVSTAVIYSFRYINYKLTRLSDVRVSNHIRLLFMHVFALALITGVNYYLMTNYRSALDSSFRAISGSFLNLGIRKFFLVLSQNMFMVYAGFIIYSALETIYKNGKVE